MEQEVGLIPEQRKSRILEIIYKQGTGGVREIAGLVGASVATVRRDLAELEERGSIKRIRGGAMLTLNARTTFEPDSQYASQVAVEQKEAIGRAAAEMIVDGESVIFDSSSTVHQAARFAQERCGNILAVTNDVETACLLARGRGIKVQVLGGSLRPGSYTLLGDPGQEFLNRLHVEVCFLGIQAIHLPTRSPSGFKTKSVGLSDTSTEVAAMKRAMLRAARRRVVLADSSKFGQLAFCEVCRMDEIDSVITDSGLDPAIKGDLESLGVEVITV